MSAKLVSLGLLSLVAAEVLFAADLRAADASAPLIRTTVDEVSLDLVVRDKHGKQIRDLRPADVQVIDDGLPVELKSLRFIDTKTRASAPADSELRDFRLVTIVFDRLNTSSQRLARQAVEELIRTAAGPNTFFGVWLIRDSLHLLQSFTPDTSALVKAVEIATATHRITRRSGDKTALQSAGDDLNIAAQATGYGAASMLQIEERLFTMQQKMADASDALTREENAHESLSPLLALVREQASISGRKSLIYVSEGLQVTSNTQRQLQAIIGAANRAGVAIYALDTSGLNQAAIDAAQQGMNAGTSASMRPDGYVDATGLLMNNSASIMYQQMNPMERDLHNLDAVLDANQAEPMRRLAAATGGIYLGNSNDLRPSIHRLVEDMTSYYQATYVPSSHDYDGHFRTVVIYVARPKVTVQSRAGYFSLPPGAGSDVAGFEVPLLKALNATARTETIQFDAVVMSFRQTSSGREAALLAQIPLTGFTAQEDDTTKLFRFRAAIVALIRAKDGRILRKLSQEIPFQGALNALAKARKGDFTVQRTFTLPPGEYVADVAVEDSIVKKISSKRLDFILRGDPPDLSLSDIMRVRGLEPGDASSDRSEPLRFRGRRIIPELLAHNAIQPGPEMPVFFAIYGQPAQPKPDAELQLRQGDEVLMSAPLPLPQANPGDPIPVLTAINTAQLPPGSYTLVAKIHQGKVTLQSQLAFSVSGTPNRFSKLQPQTLPETHVKFLAEPKVMETSARIDDEHLREIVAETRARAAGYKAQLPNLVCLQVTRRFADMAGNSGWIQKDHIVRLVRYMHQHEASDLIEYNGRKAVSDTAEIRGISIEGVFGDLVDMVLNDKNQAAIQWKGLSTIGSNQVNILEIIVKPQHSGYRLIGNSRGDAATVGYHALIYVDALTYGIRRIELEAQDVPDNFPMRQSALSVDYDYVSIGGHNFLLPQTAVLYVREGRTLLKKNEIQYRDYRRFGSESSIRYATAR